MKQVLLITDGCSNVGISPVVAAAHAHRMGVIVNVVGVIDDGDIGERGAAEIAAIAEAGGGMSRIVAQEALPATVQMMTRKTVVQTVQQAVQRELRQLIGPGAALERLAPEQRAPVVRMIDDISETTPLRVAMLIDTSASMRPKLKAVEEACRDLLISLRARQGRSELAVLHFPGNTEADLLAGWTADLAKAGDLFYNLNIRGTTPTGPALLKAARYVLGVGNSESGALAEREADGIMNPDVARGASCGRKAGSGDGIWSDYVV